MWASSWSDSSADCGDSSGTCRIDETFPGYNNDSSILATKQSLVLLDLLNFPICFDVNWDVWVVVLQSCVNLKDYHCDLLLHQQEIRLSLVFSTPWMCKSLGKLLSSFVPAGRNASTQIDTAETSGYYQYVLHVLCTAGCASAVLLRKR